jgi:hypothetical protein
MRTSWITGEASEMPVTREDVKNAYTMILGRPPESDRAIDFYVAECPDIDTLRNKFLLSREFRLHMLNKWSRFAVYTDEPAKVSAARKLAFLHIPKTAGTSLRYWLDGQFEKKDIFPHEYQIRHFPAAEIASYRFFRGHYSLFDIRHIPGSVTTFTVLREPRARLLSQYYYYRSFKSLLPKGADANARPDPLRVKARLNLNEYFSDPDVRNFREVDNFQTRILLNITPDIVQKYRININKINDPIRDLSVDVVKDIALSNLRSISYVGVVDDFDEFCRGLLHELKFPLPPGRLELNVTTKLANTSPAEFAAVDKTPPDDQTHELMHDLVALDEYIYQEAKKISNGLLREWRLAEELNTPTDADKHASTSEIDRARSGP